MTREIGSPSTVDRPIDRSIDRPIDQGPIDRPITYRSIDHPRPSITLDRAPIDRSIDPSGGGLVRGSCSVVWMRRVVTRAVCVCVCPAPRRARARGRRRARHAVTMQVGTKEVTIGDGTTLEVSAFV